MIDISSFISYVDQRGATLVAVSKTKSPDDILTVYNEGIRNFGENRVQELVTKHEVLPADVQWHMIGHLQSNKVKYIAPFVHMIHSVDSLKLLKTINKEARKNERVIPVLLQMHIAQEETKFGLDESELQEIIRLYLDSNFPHVSIKGLMGMATFTDDQEKVRSEFSGLRDLFQRIKDSFEDLGNEFCHLSMGMSGDFEIALDCGSTMIRVGSLIFGPRSTNH